MQYNTAGLFKKKMELQGYQFDLQNMYIAISGIFFFKSFSLPATILLEKKTVSMLAII